MEKGAESLLALRFPVSPILRFLPPELSADCFLHLLTLALAGVRCRGAAAAASRAFVALGGGGFCGGASTLTSYCS